MTVSARRAVAAQARVELLLTLRRGESLVVSLAIPVGILVFFTKVDVVQTSLRDPVQFLVPGTLARRRFGVTSAGSLEQDLRAILAP